MPDGFNIDDLIEYHEQPDGSLSIYPKGPARSAADLRSIGPDGLFLYGPPVPLPPDSRSEEES